MNLDDLYKTVKQVDTKINYWFVRTDKRGKYFDVFLKENFIGIGWNQITLDNILHEHYDDVKAKISKTLNIDIRTSKGKAAVTGIYNKLKRFVTMKKGDVVIIPDLGSDTLAFGIIDDVKAYSKSDKECDFQKRRKVKWIEKLEMKSLDPVFYQVKTTRHAISSVKIFEDYIDRSMRNLYIKDDYCHFIIDIAKKGKINTSDFIDFVASLQQLLKVINRDFQLNESPEESSIKTNVQSPGIVELTLRGKSMIIMATLLWLHGCKDTAKLENVPPEIIQFKEVNKDTLANAVKYMDSVNANWEKIEKIR